MLFCSIIIKLNKYTFNVDDYKGVIYKQHSLFIVLHNMGASVLVCTGKSLHVTLNRNKYIVKLFNPRGDQW